MLEHFHLSSYACYYEYEHIFRKFKIELFSILSFRQKLTLEAVKQSGKISTYVVNIATQKI